MYATLIVMGLTNMYAFWIVPWLGILAGLLHIGLWIIFAAVLLTLAPKHDASFVLTEKSNLSGWSDDFISFNLGMVLITWGFVGKQTHTCSPCYPPTNPHRRFRRRSAPLRRSPPRPAQNTLRHVLDDPPKRLPRLRHEPHLHILSRLRRRRPVRRLPHHPHRRQHTHSIIGGSAMVGGLLITNIAVSLVSLTSASRLTWAWARDGGLPAYFAHINPKYRVPVRSIWLSIAVVCVLSLLNLAGYIAFSVIIALSTFGLYQSYFIAIACMLYARLSGKFDISATASWSLGKAGGPVNMCALVYSLYMGIWLVTPASLPIDGSTMNYALPINAFVVLAAMGAWFVWAKDKWTGLNLEVLEMVVLDGERGIRNEMVRGEEVLVLDFRKKGGRMAGALGVLMRLLCKSRR